MHPRYIVCLVVMLTMTVASFAQQAVTLKEAARGKFRIGVAMNTAQISGADASGDALIAANFDSISPENALKWERVHPARDAYDFALADKYVAFGVAHHAYIVGHTLVWHSQTPDWVFKDAKGKPITRNALLERLRDHIFTLVGRYKGGIACWDVVNEALNEDGTLRNSKWRQILGDGYIVQAFKWAHEADPQAELSYNDYSLENPSKRAGAIALVKSLQAAGVEISVVGIQGHNQMDWPDATAETETIEAFGKLGVKVAITELDIDVLPSTAGHTADVSVHRSADPKLNPYADGLPESVSNALASRYADLFRVYVAHCDVVERVTLWGLKDSDSWLNDWPVRGRTNYPLLFNRDGRPKAAYTAVLSALR